MEETHSAEAESACRCDVEEGIEDTSCKQSVQGFENQGEKSGLHLWKRDTEGFLIGSDKCKASFEETESLGVLQDRFRKEDREGWKDQSGDSGSPQGEVTRIRVWGTTEEMEREGGRREVTLWVKRRRKSLKSLLSLSLHWFWQIMSSFRQGESEVKVGPWQGHVRRKEVRSPHHERRLEPTAQLGSHAVRSLVNFNFHLLFTLNAYLCVCLFWPSVQ